MKLLVFIAVAGFICQASSMSLMTEEEIQGPREVICNDCKVLFKDIKDLIQSEESKNTTTAAITYFVCGNETGTTLYQICSGLVNALVSPVLQILADEVEPVEACFFFSMCRPEGIYQEFKYDMRLFHSLIKKAEKEIKKDLKKL